MPNARTRAIAQAALNMLTVVRDNTGGRADMRDLNATLDAAMAEARKLVSPSTHQDRNVCPACKRAFNDGETCRMGVCPMGGDF